MPVAALTWRVADESPLVSVAELLAEDVVIAIEVELSAKAPTRLKG